MERTMSELLLAAVISAAAKIILEKTRSLAAEVRQWRRDVVPPDTWIPNIPRAGWERVALLEDKLVEFDRLLAAAPTSKAEAEPWERLRRSFRLVFVHDSGHLYTRDD